MSRKGHNGKGGYTLYDVPEPVWRALDARCVAEGFNRRVVILKALRQYLGLPIEPEACDGATRRTRLSTAKDGAHVAAAMGEIDAGPVLLLCPEAFPIEEVVRAVYGGAPMPPAPGKPAHRDAR